MYLSTGSANQIRNFIILFHSFFLHLIILSNFFNIFDHLYDH